MFETSKDQNCTTLADILFHTLAILLLKMSRISPGIIKISPGISLFETPADTLDDRQMMDTCGTVTKHSGLLHQVDGQKPATIISLSGC